MNEKKDLSHLDTHDHAGHGHDHTGDSCCSTTQTSDCGCEHPQGKGKLPTYFWPLVSLILLLMGLGVDFFKWVTVPAWARVLWYGIAYLPVGLPVLKEGWQSIKKGDLFTEFFLMSIATLGAFAIGEYPEGVAVMLFYAVGEMFQHAAVDRAKGNIRALLDVRPKEALTLQNGQYTATNPETVAVGAQVQVRVGEKIPLDGKLLSQKATVNTAAISGESRPQTLKKGDKVYAGSINLDGVIEFTTTRAYRDSSIARILDLVQNATARKSKTELFIRKFARVYTPIVTFMAIGLTLLPYFFVADYVFGEWLYRALIFLVISCPCALVISIPLGYFGGLGAASKNGILFKGASFLDAITQVKHLAMDKTGTVTRGVFKVVDIKGFAFAEAELMQYLIAMEGQSTHPIAKAILEYPTEGKIPRAENVAEIAGKGLEGTVNGKKVLVGNKALMQAHNITTPDEIVSIVESVVGIGIDGQFAGYVIIADELKDDAVQAIARIKSAGINTLTMLSGDKDSITQKTAADLHINAAKGGLLPEDKLHEVEQLKSQGTGKVAFVGDGINDAPVLAASDVGIAMGGLGSDVAIETADVIIQTDQPSKIATAIQIGRSTRHIVWQNIAMAFIVKGIVLTMGAVGIATMWEAVFADVGVALLAILNAIRLQRMQWG
ncbi:MAG: cadmium-translocating P-type ATPase [Cytophagaceae bacterium]|nr:cadmium-translocating P-type ATPase [Cytophagaceae bacterium]